MSGPQPLTHVGSEPEHVVTLSCKPDGHVGASGAVPPSADAPPLDKPDPEPLPELPPDPLMPVEPLLELPPMPGLVGLLSPQAKTLQNASAPAAQSHARGAIFITDSSIAPRCVGGT